MNHHKKKVRQLLSHAASASSPEEAETYNAKAYELIVQYSIEDWDEDESTLYSAALKFHDPYGREAQYLYAMVCSALGSVRLYDVDGTQIVSGLIAGAQKDVESALILAESLWNQSLASLAADPDSTPQNRSQAFLRGYADVASRRIEQKAQEVAGERGAIVLANKVSRIDEEVFVNADRGPDVKCNDEVDYGSYFNGRTAGLSANIGNSLEGSLA